MQFYFLPSDIPAMQPIVPHLENSRLLSQIVSLYQEQGWWNDATDTHNLLVQLIANSHCFLIGVTDGPKVVAMGRAISDRTSDAYIQDVAVQRGYRKAGMGTAVITRIIERLQSDGITWIGLISEKNSHPFYEKIGFTRLPGAFPMIYGRQAADESTT